MGNVLTLPVGNLDAAWDRYSALARRFRDEPTDRKFYQEFVRRQDRFRKPFLMQDGGR